MFKVFQIIITLCCTSFFFFPFFPSILPSVNTKMVMAACGLVVLWVELSRKQAGTVSKDFLLLSLLAVGISGASFLSMVINDTPDKAYLSYIVSMWVWIGAAYFVTKLIKWTHGELSVELMCFYLVAVSTIQCLIAIYADMNAGFKSILDSMMVGEGFMGKNEGRLYGLGCALDVAGSKFASILVMIAFLLPRMMKRDRYYLYFCPLLFAYTIIGFVGNMIGRTTLVGFAVSILYLLFAATIGKEIPKERRHSFSAWFFGFILLAFIVGTYLYNSNPQWRHNIRFGFEGIFSLVETGKWEVSSNNQLLHQYVWPDNTKTWILGDGYFDSTSNDPFYIGKEYKEFYMGTDAGYCRFIFYFGIIGLMAFSIFMIKVVSVCKNRFPKYRYLFLWILSLNFIVWIKVSTDIFLVFAPFLCIAASEQEEYEKSVNAIEQT